MAIIGRVTGRSTSGGARVTAGFKLDLNPNLLRDATREGVKLMPKIAQQFKAAIARRSPFQFGTNRRSIEAFKVSEFVQMIASMSGYGGYLEFGFRRKGGGMAPPRPYFRQGAEFMASKINKLKNASDLDRPIQDPGTPLMFGPAAKAV